MLRFDWEEVGEIPISAVLGRNQSTLDNGALRCDEIAFVVRGKAVLLTVCEDTDQIAVDLGLVPDGHGWANISSLDFAVGQTFGWCWVGVNYLGYKDCFTVAFGDVVPDALEPRLMFVAEASGMVCMTLSICFA